MLRSSSVTNSEVSYIRILIPFTIGIIWAGSLNYVSTSVWLYLVSVSFCLILVINLNYIKLAVYRHKLLLGVLLNLFLFLSGGFLTSRLSQKDSKHHFSRFPSSLLKISVDEEPQLKNNVIRFKAKVIRAYGLNGSRPVGGNLMVSIKNDAANYATFNYGDMLLLPAKFEIVPQRVNPATFDYKTWLSNRQIYHQCYLGSEQVEKLAEGKGNQLVDYLIKLRKRQVNYIKETFKRKADHAFFSTLILGYRSELDEEITNIYAETGTIHALSVSGMHVGLIYLMLNLSLSFLNRSHILKTIKLIIIILFIWFYALLTGFAPSILRAAIMISVFIIGKYSNRTTNGCNILAFTGFMLLAYNPFYIWDIGFQLSFLSMIGLVYLHPIINGWFDIQNSLLHKIWELTSISLAAQYCTFPLSIFYFHSFPLYFLISNLFIVIPITLLMYTGVFMLIFKLDILAPVMEWLILLSNSGLAAIAGFPGAAISGIWLSKPELLLLCFFLIVVIVALVKYDKRLIVVALFAMLILLTVSGYQKISAFNERKIVVFKIKNGYATAFLSCKTAVVLTNLTQEEKLFKREIQPYLDQQMTDSVYLTEGDDAYQRDNFRIRADRIQFYDHILSLHELKNYKSFSFIYIFDHQ